MGVLGVLQVSGGLQFSSPSKNPVLLNVKIIVAGPSIASPAALAVGGVSGGVWLQQPNWGCSLTPTCVACRGSADPLVLGCPPPNGGVWLDAAQTQPDLGRFCLPHAAR